jgi:hypothetical protein
MLLWPLGGASCRGAEISQLPDLRNSYQSTSRKINQSTNMITCCFLVNSGPLPSNSILDFYESVAFPRP